MSPRAILFGGRRTGTRERRRTFSPKVTVLEPRELMATYVVTNTSDSASVQGSLRWAVTEANYTSKGLDYINFQLPGDGPYEINITDTLFLNDQVVIDGTSQPGYNGCPVVSIIGASTTTSLFLLQADPSEGTSSTSSTIQGLSLSNYRANAITILSNSTSNWIQKNWIGFRIDVGFDVHLTTDAFTPPNFYPAGVGIQSNFNVIRENTISGVYNGIIMGEGVNATSQVYKTNSIRNNNIGTDHYGTTSEGYGNLSDGIFLGSGARENFIGPDNVISGNESAGVELLHQTNTKNVIFRNRIGTDNAGAVSIPNGELGVLIANGGKLQRGGRPVRR